MGWGPVRQEAYRLQDGLCAVCGRPLPRRFVCHHVVNKHCGGQYVLYNADGSIQCECRCPECETQMHDMYRHGNKFDIPQERVATKRQQKKAHRKARPPKQPTIVWLYYEDIRFYMREAKRGSHSGRRLRVDELPPKQSRDVLPRVRERDQKLPVRPPQERRPGRGRVRRNRTSGRYRWVRRVHR